MPYVITTTTRELTTPVGLWRGSVLEETSRRAVATLDEARDIARAAIPREATNTAWERAAFMPEQGGTVGPLPDGTVIEVERVSGSAIAMEAIMFTDSATPTDAELLAAFNSSQ